MTPLSLDLRERIVSSYLNGEGSHKAVAERFCVSKSVVGKLVRQYRTLGTLKSQVHLRGRKKAVRDGKQEVLQQHLQEYPDATLQERIEALGVECTQKTMWQTLRRLGWRFKKNRRVRPNRIGKTLQSGVRTGEVPSRMSILNDSFSSMKPESKRI